MGQPARGPGDGEQDFARSLGHVGQEGERPEGQVDVWHRMASLVQDVANLEDGRQAPVVSPALHQLVHQCSISGVLGLIDRVPEAGHVQTLALPVPDCVGCALIGGRLIELVDRCAGRPMERPAEDSESGTDDRVGVGSDRGRDPSGQS